MRVESLPEVVSRKNDRGRFNSFAITADCTLPEMRTFALLRLMDFSAPSAMRATTTVT